MDEAVNSVERKWRGQKRINEMREVIYWYLQTVAGMVTKHWAESSGGTEIDWVDPRFYNERVVASYLIRFHIRYDGKVPKCFFTIKVENKRGAQIQGAKYLPVDIVIQIFNGLPSFEEFALKRWPFLVDQLKPFEDAADM